MHVKVSILKPILVFSSMPPLFQDLQTLSGSDVYLIFVTYPPTPHPQGVLVGLMAGSPEWTGLKGLKLLIALASTFQRIFWLQKNCFQADRTLKPGSAAGKKWHKTDWNGIKNRLECLDRPFSLPRLYRLAWLALFFFFLSFECSSNYGARSQAKLIAVQDFVFLNSLTWISFCTSKTLFPFPSPPHS